MIYLNITNENMNLIRQYVPSFAENFEHVSGHKHRIPCDVYDEFREELIFAIEEYGMDNNYSLIPLGYKLQNLYDILIRQARQEQDTLRP